MSVQAEAPDPEDQQDGGEKALVRAQALFDKGDLPGAEAALGELSGRRAQAPKATLLLSRIRVRQGRSDEALAVVEAGSAAFPNSKFLRGQLGRLLLKLDRPSDAERALAKACEDIPSDAGVHALHADACLLSGDFERALTSIEAACRFDSGSGEYQLRKVAALALTRRMSEARELFNDLRGKPEDVLALFEKIATFAMRDDRADDIVSVTGTATSLFPDTPAAFLFAGEYLAGAGKSGEAVAVFDKAAELSGGLTPKQTIDVARGKAKALRALNDDAGAAAVLEQAVARYPDDEGLLYDLYVLNQRLGRTDAMRNFGKRLSNAGAKTLPPDLKSGLAGLSKSRAPRSLLADKLKWAWEIAGRPESEYVAWKTSVQWGADADALLRAWWLNAPERASQIDDLLEWPANNALDTIDKKARCIAVTTHLGPMAGQVRYLQTCGRPFRGFGVAGPDPAIGDAPPMRIAARGGDAGALRQLIHEIERGTLMGFAPDVPTRNADTRLELLGRTIAMSSFVPRIIYKYRPACVMVQALWRNGRIALEVERLPEPEDGETIEAWCTRWCEAYLARVARVMTGAPENLNLGTGIWQNVSSEFARRQTRRFETVSRRT